jgi:DNA-binding response OmpR family regulator
MATVLIIDDDADVLTTLALLLEEVGYETHVARDGVNGMRIFDELRPDIVLTDIVMPDCDGIEIIRQIRALDVNARIIAMSGRSLIGNSYYLPAAKELGATAVLAKPFTIEVLVDTVKSCLR